jgi:Mg2+/Co2+ transporter CorC
LQAIVHDVAFVPETKLLFEMMKEFLDQRFHIAMVVDEFGTVVGLLTVEDAADFFNGLFSVKLDLPG